MNNTQVDTEGFKGLEAEIKGINSSYMSVSHISPSVFVDVDQSGQQGRVLLFCFFVAKTKEQALEDEVMQNTIKIIINPIFEKSLFLGMNDFEYTIWGATFLEIATKGNLYLTCRPLPENFWELDERFRDRIYSKAVSSALSEITDIENKSTNTLELDVLLGFAKHEFEDGKRIIKMKQLEDFDRIKGYTYQIPSSERKKARK